MTSPLRGQGLQELRDGNAASAADLLARAVLADSQDAEAQMYLGVAYSQMGMHDEARRALHAAVQLRPQEARYHFNLAVALEMSGDLSGAVSAYRRILQTNPAHGQARTRLQALAPQGSAGSPGEMAPDGSLGAAPWQRGQAEAAAPRTIGPAGAIQCARCSQWSRPGLSCEWCSAPLKSIPAPAAAPWLQSPYRGTSTDLPGSAQSVGDAPDMPVGEAFLRRLAASFLDSLILMVVAAVMIFGARVSVYWVYLVEIVYEAGMISTLGQTLGGMALGIRVVGPDGENPGLWRAVLRQISAIVLSDTVFGLGYLWMLWDSQQQTWHDKIAGTHVVRA